MITCSVPYKAFNFPVGERHVQIEETPIFGSIVIRWEYEHDNELIEVMLLVNAIRQRDASAIIELVCPYVPFSRQDRVHVKGEPLSIQFVANCINASRFERVTITDPHSDVTPALLERCTVIEQHEIFGPVLQYQREFVLVSPDGGALKKVYKLAAIVKAEAVIECSKRRDVRTGAIDGVVVPSYYAQYAGYEAIIVDDICDGGKTFVELAKALQREGAKKITLMVTHGFFTKGLGVFEGLIDHIYTRKGQVK